ncbi:MAG: Curculin protein [Candidatus Saccharibacteria bacterium]|nr:Curculin protein [Candidatus Saccharibacteria bacterium]
MSRRFNYLAYFFVVTIFVLSFSVFNSYTIPKANALANSEFDASRIIDDSVFFNPNSMNTDEIQVFLNSKVPVCETNHSQDGYPYPPPYTCLKDFVQVTDSMAGDSFCGPIAGGSKSAATIIKEVSAACSVNPQILLILLQKEQSLITDTWPLPSQYTKATGYGCPDSTVPSQYDSNSNNCYDEYEGYFKQVYYGARQYQKYAKQPLQFNFRAGQTANIAFNPSASCGSSSVTIQNQATAGLYNYTPYQPNAAVLNSTHGETVPCGAYGNINFWWQFWNWFGNPIGSPYAWLIDSFTYSGGDNLIAQGETETITLKAKNVGRLPWYNHGNNPVRLGTWENPDHSSALLNGGNRFATLTESVVQPNSIGTFTFTVTPSTIGTYIESMNLVVENSQWMSWPGFRPTINVTSPYNWQIQDVIYENGTGVMDPGTRQLITVKAKNTGNTTWVKNSTTPVRLGTWLPDRKSAVSSSWLSQVRAADMNEQSVAPGQTAGFQFYINMPSSGNFYERLNLVAEGQTWLNDPGLTLYLRGRSYQWQPVWSSLSTGTVDIPRNTNFTYTLKVKNVGEASWTRTSGKPPVRLGTSGPLNRGSSLYTPSWINDTRPSGLIEDTVAPGDEGTFTFNGRTPSTPGQRIERFNLVAEGVAWFSSPDVLLYINVL